MPVCKYCGWSDGHHHKDCPPQDSLLMTIWERGFQDGKAGKRSQISNDVSGCYELGFERGAKFKQAEEEEIQKGWFD